MFINSIAAEDIDRLDLVTFPGSIQVISSVGSEFNNAIKYLRSQKIIGFDTETRPCFSATQPRYGVALLHNCLMESGFRHMPSCLASHAFFFTRHILL